MTQLVCYGGVNEIGGNKLLVGLEKGSIFLDFGLSFAEESIFFEEFMKPRSGCKLHDLLKLGLLPQIHGVYREDALRPIGFAEHDFRGKELWETNLGSYEDAVGKRSSHPDAVFISHAHLDHCGYLPYLGDIPLVCSEMTAKLMNAISEIGNLQGLDNQLAVMKRKKFSKLKSGYFPGELKTDYAEEAESRDIRILGHRKSQAIDKGTVITGFDVGHSIPGSMACLVESRGSQIVYTGDLRFHGRSGHNLGDELKGLKPDIMICEGTRIHKEEKDDEEQVENELADLFSKCDGLAIVGFAWKDIERYETVRDAAIKSGRTAVFDPRLAYLLARIDRDIYKEKAKTFLERCGCMLYSPGDYVYSKHKIGQIARSDWCSKRDERVVDTTHFEKGVSAIEIGENPDSYVLHLDFFRIKNLLDLDPPEGSVFVRAQCEPLNRRMTLSEERLIRWLKHFGINSDSGHKPYQIHASGHASGPEIQEMIEEIRPRILVPVHTLKPDLHRNPAGSVIKPQRGLAMNL